MKKNKFTKNQLGQGVMEYLIITSLVGVVAIVGVKSFGKTVKNKIMDIKETINQEIQIKS